MKFKVTIATDNAAFMEEDDPRPETARILRELADRLDNGADTYILHDANGNTVGRASFG